MKLSKATRPVTWYAPAALGNRAAPEGERLLVEIEPLSVPELNRLRAPLIQRMTDGDVSAAQMGQELRDAVVSARVRSVRGLEDDSGPVVTGPALVRAFSEANDAEVSEVLDEVYQAITKASVLREGTTGN